MRMSFVSKTYSNVNYSERNVVKVAQIYSLFTIRKYLTLGFPNQTRSSSSEKLEFNNLSSSEKEQKLLSELLYILMGIEGSIILLRSTNKNQFTVHKSCDLPLCELLDRPLRLAQSYWTVASFIEECSSFDKNQTCQALVSALHLIIKEYLSFVCRMEYLFKEGQLTLQRLLCYCECYAEEMDMLAKICKKISKTSATAANIFKVLHDQLQIATSTGNMKSLILFLLQKSTVPYFNIISGWIYNGVILDPYLEFMLEKRQNVNQIISLGSQSENFWQQSYVIVESKVPIFLKDIADIVLNAGKYLNVLRYCGKDGLIPKMKEIVYNENEQSYFKEISEAYNYSSLKLLEILMTDMKLYQRLKSIKNYFLCEVGDFFSTFMDYAEGELIKCPQDIQQTRLESLMDLALRSSSANVDPYKDDLKIEMMSSDLYTELFTICSVNDPLFKNSYTPPNDCGLFTFCITYTVEFPLSLVLNQIVLARYQMIFRHLFFMRYVERVLSKVWQRSANNSTKVSSNVMKQTAVIAGQMLRFIKQFISHIQFAVIEPNWSTMLANLKTAKNFDLVLTYHNDFLMNTLKECMLTNSTSVQKVTNILMVCYRFAVDPSILSFHQNYARNEDIYETQSTVSQSDTINFRMGHQTSHYQKSVDKNLPEDQLRLRINEYHREFIIHVGDLIDYFKWAPVEQSESHFSQLFQSIDQNEYFKTKSAEIKRSRNSV